MNYPDGRWHAGRMVVVNLTPDECAEVERVRHVLSAIRACVNARHAADRQVGGTVVWGHAADRLADAVAQLDEAIKPGRVPGGGK